MRHVYHWELIIVYSDSDMVIHNTIQYSITKEKQAQTRNTIKRSSALVAWQNDGDHFTISKQELFNPQGAKCLLLLPSPAILLDFTGRS